MQAYYHQGTQRNPQEELQTLGAGYVCKYIEFMIKCVIYLPGNQQSVIIWLSCLQNKLCFTDGQPSSYQG
jgi:hypothetical protein